jgi:hypothetical protein
VEAAAAAPRRRGLLAASRAAGVPAGAAGGVVVAATAAAISEMASQPTAVEGVYSSTWTPITGAASVVLGSDAFHGSFVIGPILVGLTLLVAYGAAAGVPGVAFLLVTQGDRPGPAGCVVQGMAYGVALEIAVVNLGINALQDVQVLYLSMPSWGWWAVHAIYGSALYLLAARALRRSPRSVF